MNLIVAADKNWAIGRNQELLVRIPADMKNFAQMTTGHVIVMGRKTLESFPNGLPLPKRTNIVLTHQADYDGHGAIVVHDEEEMKKVLAQYDDDEIFIVGGQSIYTMFLPYCKNAYVTKLDYAYEADTWMPDLDQDENWKLVEKSEEQTCFDLIYHFTRYENTNVKSFL
ncbi:MAG: dihydrofolate reductase [Eubacteriales bacterium]|nr:dihydrofolate reductase [Eubacteriales bacterium]